MAVGNPFRGISLHALENISLITRMQVFPSEAGMSVMKSSPRCDHGLEGWAEEEVCQMVDGVELWRSHTVDILGQNA